MSKNKGHIPIRTCVACGKKRSKYELIRLVADKDGIIRQDNKGKIGGRGAYVCPEKDCLQKIISKPVLLSRALRREHVRFAEPIGGIHEQKKGI